MMASWIMRDGMVKESATERVRLRDCIRYHENMGKEFG